MFDDCATYKKRIPWNKGVPRREETKQKISESHKRLFKEGRLISWNKGKKGLYKHSEEIKQRISKALKGKKLEEQNPMWKGDAVGNYALHDWIKSRLPKKELCEACRKKPPFDLANKSGLYLRDLKDWRWLCRKCHMISDGRLMNLKQYQTCKNCGADVDHCLCEKKKENVLVDDS